MANTKEYKIVINGLTESINAVDALNKQLDTLEKRINALQAKSVSISTGGGGSKGTTKSALSEEEKLAKKIEEIDAKRVAYSKEIYQSYLASKEILNETLKDQREIAASERLQANTYSNTMKGLKQQLADIKQVMQTTDIGSDIFKKYTAEANEITNKLKELEEAYGQFGRNVGNYKSAADGFNKIRIAVGDTTREYDNYRQAIKALRGEQFQLSQTLGQESKEYKDVHNAIKQLESTYKDLSVSSKFMDNMLDSMTTITAAANVGVGLSNFFGIDDQVFEDAMRKMVGLSQALQGLEVLKQQWQADDSWLLKPFKMLTAKLGELSESTSEWLNKNVFSKIEKGITTAWVDAWYSINSKDVNKEFGKLGERALDKLVDAYSDEGEEKIEKIKKKWAEAGEEGQRALYARLMMDKRIQASEEGATRGINMMTKALRLLGTVAKSVFAGAFLLFLPEIIQYITDFVKSLDKTKIAAESAEKSLNTLNRTLEKRMELLSSSYMKGDITSEEYLKRLYDEQTDALDKQIDLLKARADAAKDNGVLGTGWFTSSENADFTGKKMAGTTTVSSGMFNQLNVTVKDIDEVEKAWRRANAAIKQGKDYIDMWGEDDTWYQRLKKDLDSMFATVSQTEDVMKGMGNIKLSDTIAQFQDLTSQLSEGRITTDDFAKEVAKLRDEMNSNDILNSVIANLDKYIPDEAVREQIQNIINKIYELDDAFNMTSPQQIHHWNQVRIDAMKDGLKKTLAQIDENERYEIQQEAKTEEQKKLIQAKYARQRQDARDKEAKENLQKAKENGKKLQDAENQLIALRIENMKDGLDKRLAELDNQRRLELQKVKDNGVKVGELSVEINKKYDKLIVDERRKWAFEVLKVYEDLLMRITQMNQAIMETNAASATQNVETGQRKSQQSAGYSMITPSSYDDSKALEEYYAKVVQIKQEAAEKELEIEKYRLEKSKDYAKEEEKLRHSRLINQDGGEYITQLRAGLITQEQYDELIEKENKAHADKMASINEEYNSNLSAKTQDTLEEVQKLYSDFYGNVINDLRSDKAKVDEIMSQQPVTDKQGWGVVNTKKTSENYKTALAEYDKLKKEIVKKQRQLEEDLNAHRISPETFAIRQKELDQEVKAIDNAVKGITERQKQLIADFMQSIQQYIQAVADSFNQIMSAVWDAQDNGFDKEQDEIDKMNDELDKKLDEQQEIIEKHKSAIDSIEDELATSRGDRRQHLIDQLNAEMAAQREAAAQEKKIQQQKEAQQKKQDELDKKRKKAQYQRDMMQAVVNGAMAVTYAAVNAWPIPAIPMMALAAATTAAQLAIMSSNKPYAKGGQLDGPSHREGGIKVPGIGGGIELEGQEYVIRKKTTNKNVDLLDYINKSEKKLTLDDFIDFYGTKARRTIKSISPKGKYADGGMIPTLSSNNIDINDKLISALEAYNERDVVVSVVDINNRQNQVKNVQVLAGLTE